MLFRSVLRSYWFRDELRESTTMDVSMGCEPRAAKTTLKKTKHHDAFETAFGVARVSEGLLDPSAPIPEQALRDAFYSLMSFSGKDRSAVSSLCNNAYKPCMAYAKATGTIYTLDDGRVSDCPPPIEPPS